MTSSPVGAIIGYIVPVFFISSADYYDTNLARQHVYTDLLYQAIWCSVLALFILLLFRNKPPTPPSASSNRKKEASSCTSFGMLLGNNNMYILGLIYGFVIASLNTSGTIEGEVVSAFGYTTE